jgi:hypothetical protein
MEVAMPVWVRARTVIEEKTVSADIAIFRQQFVRFDDAYNALQWTLSRKAETLGLHSSYNGIDYRLYRQDSDPVARTPSLVVVYWYTKEEVTITALQATPP